MTAAGSAILERLCAGAMATIGPRFGGYADECCGDAAASLVGTARGAQVRKTGSPPIGLAPIP
jgi:hypothetical protein